MHVVSCLQPDVSSPPSLSELQADVQPYWEALSPQQQAEALTVDEKELLQYMSATEDAALPNGGKGFNACYT